MSPQELNYEISTVRLVTFESNSRRLQFSGNENNRPILYTENIHKLNELEIDINSRFMDTFKNKTSTSPLLAQMFVLDHKSEVVERKVYEFFQMLADIGGFADGLELCLSFLIFAYNARMYFIRLSRSLIRLSHS